MVQKDKVCGRNAHNTTLQNLQALFGRPSPIWEIADKFYKNLDSHNSNMNFNNIIVTELSDQDLIMVINLWTNLSNYPVGFEKHNLIKFTVTDQFFDRIVEFLRIIYDNKNKCIHYLEIILKFYESILIYLPACSKTYDKTRVILHMIQKCLNNIDIKNNAKETEFLEQIEDILDILDDKDNHIDRKITFYKGIDIFPSIVDLFEKKILVSNIVKGPYKNAEHYLDINFKLLKEDFVNAIKEGFESYRSTKRAVKAKSTSDFDFYRNVQCPKICAGSGCVPICHLIEFSKEDHALLNKYNWEESKKFMNGSILFFSRNDFQTFFAGIIQLNFMTLTYGRRKALKVSIIGDPLKLKLNTYYDMAEPRYFFGQYHYSLKMLKHIDPHCFPMAEHIISVSNKVFPSSLVSNSPCFNSSIGKYCYDGDDLNESQVSALNVALSERFSLIQGPPGTGKSYVARKIMNILASDPSDERPVLVVCMRNKALDILLEPLVMAGIEVVRLGRTTSELLEEQTLFNLKQKWQKKKKKTACIKMLQKRMNKYKNLICKGNAINGVSLKEMYNHHNDACEALRLHLDYYDGQNILSRKIKVIGATIHGAAKRNAMLSDLNPKAVIIEEAAEILESFLVSSIPLSCDHLILIGDHLQLQPITSSFKSATKYNMNISFFERMVLNGKQFCQLNVQHRMRPEIAELICPFIYKDIVNHQSVYEFEDIIGVSKNLFFISHSVNEDYKGTSRSFSNVHEADFLLALANYLILQGYRSNEISILAAYSAQQQLIIDKVRNYPLLSNIEIQSIDNYQGNENNIILLSLVRSNSPTVGFLAKSNRVNVALSRAKKGLFIIGNMKTLAKHSKLFKDINAHLISRQAVGERLPLKCKTHGRVTNVSKSEEINALKNGGCNKRCDFRMKCRHLCDELCHPYFDSHDSYCKICFRRGITSK